jgi:hypothetical protein
MLAIGARTLVPSDADDRTITYLECDWTVTFLMPTEKSSFESLAGESFLPTLCR